ncbi:MAG: tRNA (guanosine(46)-N7)-methyltransferase TrmB [Bacteroidia bacterium]
MGKNKLARFEQNLTFKNMVQLPESMCGKWQDFFGNQNPLTLELACGHGAYTVGLARLFPERNFIGIDRKGARMWKGAKTAMEENLENAAFMRIQIDHCAEHFAPNEVDEIWITFADPQPNKDRKKLTHPMFLTRYKQFLKTNGIINLKTDDDHLYEYTLDLIKEKKYELLENQNDIYNWPDLSEELKIKTYYETKWLEKGKTIKYLKFRI